MGGMSAFEIFDFPPLFGVWMRIKLLFCRSNSLSQYIDPHAIWHGCIIIVTALFTQFLIADAKFFIHAKGMEREFVFTN
jgi:hypothetical protein